MKMMYSHLYSVEYVAKTLHLSLEIHIVKSFNPPFHEVLYIIELSYIFGVFFLRYVSAIMEMYMFLYF